MRLSIPTPLALAWLFAAAAPMATAQVASFDFSEASQFSDNFKTVLLSNGTLSYSTTAGGRLEHTRSSSTTMAVWAYDTTPDATPTNLFGGSFEVEADFSLGANASSFGVYFGGEDRTSATSALALFNMNIAGGTGTSEQLRLFTGGSVSAGGSGTASAGNTVIPTETGYVTNTLYRLTLQVSYVSATSADVTLTVSDPYATGAALTPISVTGTLIGLTSPTEIAFRSYLPTAGTNVIDNIVITAIPEPATAAMLGGLIVLGIAAWRRRARRRGGW